MTTYGYFDDTRREYVITDPQPPTKWINYVGTLDFGGIVDHTGGMLICKGDPALNRITKYIPQLPDTDFKGSTLYLRVWDGDVQTVLSPLFVPMQTACDRYECRVGMGYSRIISEAHGLRTEVTIFVPTGADCVVQDIRVTNLGEAPRRVEALPVVEYTHFDALKQYTNADWVPQTMQSWAVRDGDHTILGQCAFMKRGIAENYFTASLPADSFETDRRTFLGRGSWANPAALDAPALRNSEALRGDNIGALLLPLGTLAPGATARVITLLGQASSVDAALPTIRQYRDPAAVDAALADLNAYWTDYLDTVQVTTPDPALNSILNGFNPRQCHTTKNWSRYLSLYQLGLGSRGIGFRDSSQDVMGVMAHMPDEARDLLSMLLGIQMRAGYAMHQMNPLSGEGNMLEPSQEPERPQYYSDDHLWAVLATCAYLKETGDFAYLDADIPFYDRDKDDNPLESGPVREHLRRAIEFTRGDTGAHGLPLAGFADWNDTVNFYPGAESMFTASLYGRALLELIELAHAEGDAESAERYAAYHQEMKARVNAQAWDGAWYVRYFDPAGNPVGSHTNAKGQIFTNAQSWTVLAGYADADRARTALDSVHSRLNTAKGIKLSTPGYDGYDPQIGGVSTFPPGAKENGGIFLHSNPWVIIAETMQGNGDRAYAYYNQINPAAKNDLIDEYEIEPYVYAQNILGDEHPQFGLGRNSWLSGTASWMYQAGTQYILGVRPTYDGLLVDPCIPADWDGFTVIRRFRGATYRITVKNSARVNRGVKSVMMDGLPVNVPAGNRAVLPIMPDGEHEVTVVMG
jgi:cellobiose phosphorylase